MKTAIVSLKSVSPLVMGKFYEVEKLPKESSADYEQRTWNERLHFDEKGDVFIPPQMFKNCLSEAAKYLSVSIPGQGKAKFTKHFEAGVMVTEPLMIGVKKDDVPGFWLFVPADGKRGGTKRVKKCFPIIHSWAGTVAYIILDETVTEDVFAMHLEQAGKFIGLGAFRPRNNGYYGRFEIEKIKWE